MDISSVSWKRCKITGGLGQLGQNLAENLRKKYGRNSVLLTDIKKPPQRVIDSGFYITLYSTD